MPIGSASIRTGTEADRGRDLHHRRHRLLLTLAVMFACQPLAAQASVVCESLRLSLASQPEVIADTSEMRRYSSAIARQNLEIRKIRYDMRRLRCDGAVVQYRSDGTSQCGELSTALTRMESNKRMLAGKRDALRQQGAGTNPSRERLLAALEANGCNAEQPGPDMPLAPPGTLSRPVETTEPMSEASRATRFQTFTGHGSLRTLCVRTCDGAFFPISSNTSPLNFRRDAQICEQMCPETETELYYHSMRTEESADMVSAETGQPYRMLPTAFAYLNRSSGEKPSCGCDLAGYYRRMQGQTTKGSPDQSDDKAVIEIGRPAASDGKPGAKPPRPAAVVPQDRTYDPQSASVRQVGPTFLPSATGDIDLRNPALSGPQPLQQ